MPVQATPTQSLYAFPATAFRESDRAELGNRLRPHTALQLNGDYVLDLDFVHARLSVHADEEGGWRVAEDTRLGQTGASLQAEALLTFRCPQGQTHSVLQLAEVDNRFPCKATYLAPLEDLKSHITYRLVGIDRCSPTDGMSHVPSLFFTNGTHITLASGAQRPIEELRVGDRVLTRDDGPQDIRWIGRTTMPTGKEFAPVLIKAGALKNLNDLIVGPNHRLFVSQCQAGQAGLMVKASHLINGDTIHRLPGDNLDYAQILLDRHRPIYAEGIAAEATLMEVRAKPSLPPELLDKLTGLMPGRKSSKRKGFDVQQALLSRPDAFDLIRRASTR